MQPSSSHLARPCVSDASVGGPNSEYHITRRDSLLDPSTDASTQVNPHLMGQGASTPRNGAENSYSGGSGSQQQNDGDDTAASVASENSDRLATRRMHRRVHSHNDHFTRLRNRLMSSSSSLSSSSSNRNRLPSLRFRARNARLSSSRSPSPSVVHGGPNRTDSAPRRRTMPPISRPMPMDEPFETQGIAMGPDAMDTSTEPATSPPGPVEPPTTSSESRGSRLSRFRSWANVMEMGSGRIGRASSRRQSQSYRPSVYDSGVDSYGINMDTDTISGGPVTSDLFSESDPSRTERPSLPGPGSLFDGFDNPTRARPGEDQAAMLSRLLSVAAAATAASLVGNAEQAITEAQDVAGDNGGDGSFESFLRTLQNGRLAAALRNGGNELGGGAPADGSPENGMLSLNFFRMFRFGSTTTQRPHTRGEEDTNENSPARTVPVIIVGIRSVTPRDGTDNAEANRPQPFFDALANLPVTIPGSIRRSSRHGNSGRRASVGASSSSSTGNEPARAVPFPSDMGVFPQIPVIPSSLADTPPGPHPPPSTPADLGLPSTNPSVASQPNATLPEEAVFASADDSSTASTSRADAAHRRLSRRLSNPEPAHPFGFSSGRNGLGSTEAAGRRRPQPANMEVPRSWIIYVLGGSYPENHPILTTPSLFTDAPTYDDMLLLSSLLGPVKPPVAAQADVDNAGGVFTIGGEDNPPDFRPVDGERCLVCLCDYEQGNECRQLNICRHVFHRECIDQWLTTGRNSCPLCRREGVEEKDKSEEPAVTQSTADMSASVDQTSVS